MVDLDNVNLAEEEKYSHSSDDEYILRVKKHYSLLGEPCKELLNRFYFEKEPLKEIAVFFTWTEATAKNNKYRCLEKLRNLVNPKM